MRLAGLFASFCIGVLGLLVSAGHELRMTGFSFGMGPAEILVRSDDADRASELLDSLTAPPPERDSSPEPSRGCT